MHMSYVYIYIHMVWTQLQHAQVCRQRGPPEWPFFLPRPTSIRRSRTIAFQACAYVCVYVYVCISMCVYTYIYIYIYILFVVFYYIWIYMICVKICNVTNNIFISSSIGRIKRWVSKGWASYFPRFPWLFIVVTRFPSTFLM